MKVIEHNDSKLQYWWVFTSLYGLRGAPVLEFVKLLTCASMNKKNLSETDICDKFITPALQAVGWD